MYFSKTPSIARYLFKGIIWNIPTKEKKIYLTFDDGPTPEITEWTLSILKKYNAKATFFCIAKNIEKYPEIFQKIISDDHSIGNHTYDHPNGWKTNTKEYLENVEKCNKVIGNQFSVTSKQEKRKTGGLHTKYRIQNTLFRPPYGKITYLQYSKLKDPPLGGRGASIVMWDVLSGDFDQKISGEKCFNNVRENAKEGSVVIFHDSEKASKNLFYALPETLEFFLGKGYSFEAL